jgi:hypothetical protein
MRLECDLLRNGTYQAKKGVTPHIDAYDPIEEYELSCIRGVHTNEGFLKIGWKWMKRGTTRY